MRILFFIIIMVHGLIHLMGFIQGWDLGKVDQLSGNTLVPLNKNLLRAAGTGWLLATLLFLTAGAGYILEKDGWCIPALAGVVLSQILIVLYWQDAKFGTAANLIILTVTIVGMGNTTFHRMANRELKELCSGIPEETRTVQSESLKNLPFPVRQWMEKSGVPGSPEIRSVYVKQEGEMRTTPEGKWMPLKAEQYFRTDMPGFIWIADVKAAPLIHLAGRDKYMNGKGHMLIKLLSLVTVADASGRHIDQGTLLRYLGETIWFPTVTLSPYITWESIDSLSARATMAWGEIQASGTFLFNEQGEITGFEADRYYTRKEGPTLERWLVEVDTDQTIESAGIRIPAGVRVTWKLDSGDFTWYRMTIKELQYNTGIPEP
ncbi:MAG TPA: hypothetical protein ENN63_03195 [Bacteroidetes bacterium]|nr:hypothetical protein [Bacteroidota bacterium]